MNNSLNIKLNGWCKCGRVPTQCECDKTNKNIEIMADLANKTYIAPSLSEMIDDQINHSIKNYDKSYTLGNDPFEELISMGELVDRLSVVNFKLYTLKDEVMRKPDDEKFRGWASIEDVKLCRERSRLKACIDKKLLTMISRVNSGDNTGGFNEEVKKYGNTPGKSNND